MITLFQLKKNIFKSNEIWRSWRFNYNKYDRQ